MAVSVESRNPEDGAGRDRVDDDSQLLERVPEPGGPHDDDGDDSIRYASPSPNAQSESRGLRQLPSPSPTPPPRIPSPSVGEVTGAPSSLAGRRYSSIEVSAMAPPDSEAIDEGVLPLLSTSLPPRELHDISEKTKRPKRLLIPKLNGDDKVLKLTAAQMEELASAPGSLPAPSPRSGRVTISGRPTLAPSPFRERKVSAPGTIRYKLEDQLQDDQFRKAGNDEALPLSSGVDLDRRPVGESTPKNVVNRRPVTSSRGYSSPQVSGNRMVPHIKAALSQTSPKRTPGSSSSRPEAPDSSKPFPLDPPPSPPPQSIPLPPMSMPTYLQLELSSSKPSPLYIHRSSASESVYESSKIKFERLVNFLLLPPQLEQILYFGSLACLDAWLYTFTILPLRFFKAVAVLIQWWGQVLGREIRFITGFIYHGSGRMWHRRRGHSGVAESPLQSRTVSRSRRPLSSMPLTHQPQSGRTPESSHGGAFNETSKHESERNSKQGWGHRHRRAKSQPSLLSSNHKADLLQGAVIICSCIILMKLDASRMYHSIRGQAAIKLYVIYNVLEVCDKLFSALGQDIFECLFSNETLERDVEGRSKLLRPFGMFILALIYNVIHAAALFYQVITLNVAVNSYSNALLTLLMSNQFVEIKSSVFKRIEKDNLFQLTCADVVERFQLWLMLMIIALRNIVEVGGLSILSNGSASSGADAMKESIPIRGNSILPNSFTILPSWTGEVLSPFLLVLGSEMLVDWVKHAYINKFNNVKPAIYQRYLDVLAKDYYTNAFVNQNLIKRIGLPVIPLSCLFIRSSVQTYHMFLATHLPAPVASTATELSVESATASPGTKAAFEHFDNIIRKALGRSALGIPDPSASTRWYLPSADDAIAGLTMLIFFLGAFFVLLACKLVLGMLLLRFARNRYSGMKTREYENCDTGGRRLGGWGMVEVDEAKRRWMYEDDPEALRKVREKEQAHKAKLDKQGEAGQDFGKIRRYEMLKRIW